ncbi:hypothetical protein V6R85_23955 [Agrobacterium sp. CCNWLW32]|uniref:hypothetical protein n=1 Tax=Agrobacterium sp. CCNWLW32 TaxID=3122072 RepID=UPI00300FC5D7
MPSLSTSDHIRQLAADNGISEVEDGTDRLARAISSLESDVPAEIQSDLRLLGRLAEIGAIDDTEMVRLVLQLTAEADQSSSTT